MTVKSLLAALVAGAVCVSCGPKDPAAGGGQPARGGNTLAGAADTTKAGAKKEGELRIPVAPIERPPAQQQVVVGGAPVSVAPPIATPAPATPAAAADTSDVPLAPKEAQWTIYCTTLADPDHVETSRQLKAALIKRTGLKEWYILHESGQSRLYYGYYRSISDASDKAETARAQTDRKKIDGLVDGGGERPFRSCQFVQLSAPDPESPPEWNLVNAPADKAWTLMIGGYKDSPERKKYAVEAVRDARARGEEAYYYHGDYVSNVFVGSWPDEAVIEERIDPAADRRKGGRADLFVLPPGMKADRNVRHKDGRDVAAVGQRLVAVDEGLQAKAQQYPNFAMNGDTIVYKAQGKTRLEGSRVTRIPRPSETSFAGGPAAGGPAAGEGPAAGDGRGLDTPDPFSRPGYEDNAAAAATGADKGQPARQKPARTGGTGAGRLRSIDQ